MIKNLHHRFDISVMKSSEENDGSREKNSREKIYVISRSDRLKVKVSDLQASR